MNNELKKELLKEIKSKRFLIYLLMLFTSLFLFLINKTTFKIIGLGGIIFSQFLYVLKEKNKLSKIIGWIYLFIFIFFFIIYVSTKVGDLQIAILTILIFFFVVLIGSLTLHFFNLAKSKNILGIILSYIGFAFTIIVIFGFIFSMLGTNEKNQILNFKEEPIKSAWNYVGFSASNFYSTNFGEIPLGKAKLVSYLELAISFIIHIIILGAIINKINNFKNE